MLLAGGTVHGDIATSPSTVTQVVANTNCADNVWHMIVFSRDSTAEQLYIYIDGVLATSGTDAIANPNLLVNSQEVWFGRSAFTNGGANPTGSYAYIGSLGEQMIYNRTLSASEVAITFRATRSRYGV